jgi:hypothetical protein
MTITKSAGTTRARLVFAGLIALAVSACAAPDRAPAVAYQAGDHAQPVAQAAPADPIAAIDDALEERMVIMISSARSGTFASY